MEQEIKNIISKIIMKRQGVSLEVTKTSNLQDDLGIDSLDSVLLLFEIEQHFLIKIPNRYMTSKYKTVQDIIDVVRKIKG